MYAIRSYYVDHMIDDLSTAADLMDWGTTPERVSKGFALGLQARIALWRGRITSYNVCYTKLLRNKTCAEFLPALQRRSGSTRYAESILPEVPGPDARI